MKVEAISAFMDKHTGQIIKPGSILDVSEKRAKELLDAKKVKAEKKERVK